MKENSSSKPSSNKTTTSKPTTNNNVIDWERAKTDSVYFMTLPIETRNMLEEKACLKYMQKNNIDPSIGKTGRICGYCNKEIWDRCAYASFIMIDEFPCYVNIPGRPIGGYEEYCAGLCGLVLG